ncbi:MAG: ArsR family transcriptional regulator [Anaerolineales bacterium]|jgi:DeoR family suf operon transcriptional repressor
MTSGTRDTILRALRVQDECTVKELAETVGISPVSVRHHLTHLQAEGLVQAKEVRSGVGRPHHVFLLTDDGRERFPSRYFRLTNRLLEEIKDSISDEKVNELFSGIADTLAERYAEQLRALPLHERLQRLVDLLSDEGFDAELELKEDQVIIRELSCPYFKLAQEHPEVCLLDQEFIAKSLSLPVEQVTCLTKGDSHCAFAIATAAEEVSP